MSQMLIAALVLAIASLATQTVSAAEPAGATAAPPATSAAPAAVAGTWVLTVETSAGTGTPTVILEQDGGTLSGTYKGRFGDQALTGTVAGNAIRFTFTVSGPMGSADVTYTGMVNDGTMKGTMQMGPQMDGRFTGRRQ